MIICSVYQRDKPRAAGARGERVGALWSTRRVLNCIINLSFCDLHDTFCLYLARRQIKISVALWRQAAPLPHPLLIEIGL